MTIDKLLSQIVEYMPHTVLPSRYSISRDKVFTLFADDGAELFYLHNEGLQSYIDMFGDKTFDEMKLHIDSDLKTYHIRRSNEVLDIS